MISESLLDNGSDEARVKAQHAKCKHAVRENVMAEICSGRRGRAVDFAPSSHADDGNNTLPAI